MPTRDDIDHIPTIVPSRDSEFPVARRSKKGNGGARPPAQSGGGMGVLARLLLVISLVVAAVACAWAWQLQQEMKQAGATIAGFENRIADLEDRLSDTDEGMSQNAAVQAAKIKELDSEVRKLWDNVWKQSKARLAKLEASSKSYDSKIAANEKAIKSAAGDLSKMKNVAGDLDRLMSSAKSNQAEVERVADTLNRINLDLAKLNRQVQSNEEGIRATDAFRRQISASIADLESAIRILQAAP